MHAYVYALCVYIMCVQIHICVMFVCVVWLVFFFSNRATISKSCSSRTEQYFTRKEYSGKG